MGRLGSLIVLVLVLASATAVATGGTTRHYLWSSGSEGLSEPPSPIVHEPLGGSYRQRAGDNPYVMRFGVAGDTVVPQAGAFHLHLADHEALFAGEYTTRVLVVDEARERVLADETFTVTVGTGEVEGEVEGWTDYHMDAVAGSGFAASGDGVLVPGGTRLLLLVSIVDGPAPDTDVDPLRTAWAEVRPWFPGPPVDDETAAAVDEAWSKARVVPRVPPSPTPLVNVIYGDLVEPFYDVPSNVAEGLDRIVASPVPVATFRFVTDDDASYLDVAFT